MNHVNIVETRYIETQMAAWWCKTDDSRQPMGNVGPPPEIAKLKRRAGKEEDYRKIEIRGFFSFGLDLKIENTFSQV